MINIQKQIETIINKVHLLENKLKPQASPWRTGGPFNFTRSWRKIIHFAKRTTAVSRSQLPRTSCHHLGAYKIFNPTAETVKRTHLKDASWRWNCCQFRRVLATSLTMPLAFGGGALCPDEGRWLGVASDLSIRLVHLGVNPKKHVNKTDANFAQHSQPLHLVLWRPLVLVKNKR